MRAGNKDRTVRNKNKPLPVRKSLASEFVKLSTLRKLSRREQVAAVCYRVGNEIEFLLVRTRGGGRWTFPKGSAEPGLTPAQAAAMEAFEEAGVHGRIEQDSFARYSAQKSSKSRRNSFAKEVVVNAYLCQVLRLGRPREVDRHRTWFSAQEAVRRLQKDRDNSSATQFARVIEKAILRIENMPNAHEPRGRQKEQRALALLSPPSSEKDGLQKVQFEARSQSYGWDARVPLLPKGIRKLDSMPSYSFSENQQNENPLPENQPRKLLQ
jgi:8-oxo-dGTP pyrophosphatase MutT (NUDIX family)